MNDRSAFWQHYAAKKGGYLEDEQTDDGTYYAWRTANQPKLLDIVPAMSVSSETWQIATLQLINQRYDRRSGQLCLMVPMSGIVVFLEGRGLKELGQKIADRAVKSIHMFDPEIHHPVSDDGPIITNIIVELS